MSRFRKAAGTSIFGNMSDASTTHVRVMPTAVADEAEVAAWAALPRDEQVRRYRELLISPACRTVTNDSMTDVLAAAQRRVAARQNG